MEIVIKGLDKAIGDFDSYVKHNDRITSASLNEICRNAGTTALRRVNKGWKGISAKDLKGLVKLTPANVNRPTYTWYMEAKPIPLILFSAKGAGAYAGTRTAKGRRRTASKVGVKYKLQTNTKTLKNSFIQKSKFNMGTAGNNLIFTKRKSPNGAEITAQSSITPVSMFEGKRANGVHVFTEIVKGRFPKRYLDKVAQLTKL